MPSTRHIFKHQLACIFRFFLFTQLCWINAFDQFLTKIPTPLSSMRKTDCRIDTKCFRFLLAFEAITATPIFGAVGMYQQKKAIPVCQFVGFFLGLSRFDFCFS